MPKTKENQGNTLDSSKSVVLFQRIQKTNQNPKKNAVLFQKIQKTNMSDKLGPIFGSSRLSLSLSVSLCLSLSDIHIKLCMNLFFSAHIFRSGHESPQSPQRCAHMSLGTGAICQWWGVLIGRRVLLLLLLCWGLRHRQRWQGTPGENGNLYYMHTFIW